MLSRIAILFFSSAAAIGLLVQNNSAQVQQKVAPQIVVSAPVPSALLSYDISDGPAVKAINKSLTGVKGSAAKGENLIANRRKGNCFACHEIGRLARKVRQNPEKYADMGKVGPRLDGVASRYSVGELRMLMVDAKKVFPQTIMPGFYRTENFYRVKKNFRDKPVLTPQEVEDVLAYIIKLKEPKRTTDTGNGIVGTKSGKRNFKIVEGPSVKAINRALTKKRGKASRGEDLMAERKKGNCFACHKISSLMHKASANPSKYTDMGAIGPVLDGVATRYSKGELRMLLVDSKQIFPKTIMPSFYRTKKLTRVMEKFRQKTVLSEQEVEDILAFLRTLNKKPVDSEAPAPPPGGVSAGDQKK